MKAMASLNLSSFVMKNHVLLRSPYYNCRFWKEPTPTPQRVVPFPQMPINNMSLLCTALLPWEAEAALPYSVKDDDQSIIKGPNVVDPFPVDASEDAPELPNSKHKDEGESFQLLKLPMWLIGPSVLLMTGMVPTLWLPLSSVFVGPNIAGLLSIVGLDCIFNMGATLFFLMADACGRPKRSSNSIESQVPLSYKLWNMVANAVGFAAPLLMLMASSRGTLQPPLPFISFAVMLGPYLLLLAVQVLTEALTWQWKSPVWLVAPVVYEVYRVLQLMRGIKLGIEIGAPAWSVESIRFLVSWWVLILGVQLFRVAWFSGYTARNQHD